MHGLPTKPDICDRMYVNDYGALITQAMTARRLSVADLSRRSGIQEKQIRRWRNGSVVPKLNTAAALADAIGCSLDELAGRPASGGVDVDPVAAIEREIAALDAAEAAYQAERSRSQAA